MILDRLHARVQALTSRWRKPPEPATDAIVRDTFDNQLCDDIFRQMPAIPTLARELNETYDHTDELVRDLLVSLHSESPELRPTEAMADSHRLNRDVVDQVMDTEEWRRAHTHSTHDRYITALTTIGLAETIRDVFEKRAADLEEAEQERQEQEQAAQQAAAAAAAAAAEAEAAAEAAEQAGLAAADARTDAEDPDSEATSEQADAAEQAAAEAEEQAAAEQAAAEQATEQAEAAAASAQEAADTATGVVQQFLAQVQAATSVVLDDTRAEAEEELTGAKAWGIGEGELKQMDFDARFRLSLAMRSNRMSEFADLIGRFKFYAAAQQAKKSPEGRDEVIGVELTGDVNDMLPGEFAHFALADDEDLGEVAELLELDWMRRLVERQMVGRQTVGIERVGRGPIVCCVDVSSSMGDKDGTPYTREAWAKAIALSLIDECRRLNRDFVGVLYDNRVQDVLHLPSGRGDVFRIMEWASAFSGGGTNFDAPLTEVLPYFDEATHRGDVVFITDGVGRLDDTVVQRWRAMHDRTGARTFGVLVGNDTYGDPLGTLMKFSDNVRQVTDLTTNESLTDVYRLLEK